MASRLLIGVPLLLAAITPSLIGADKPTKAQPSDGSSPSGGSPNSGIWYTHDDLLTTYVPGKRDRFLCYKLVKIADSTLQPFVLEQAPTTVPTMSCPTDQAGLNALQDQNGRDQCQGSTPDHPKSWQPHISCSTVDEKHPLRNGDRLVIAIDATKTSDTTRLKAVLFNISTQQGTAINPAPVRPIFSSPAAAAALALSGWYLPWPFPMTGDTIPTITVNGVVRVPKSPALETTSVAGAATTTTTDQTVESDQLITLLNFTLPQVHQMYFYNVSTGVVASTLRNPMFTRVQQTAPPNATFTTIKQNGDITAAPVLMFTAYLKPMDAESRWKAVDLTPAVSLGFSLASPATSFFFGGSSEIRRNVQFVYGVNYGKVTALAPSGFNDPTSSAAPATQQRFDKGGYFGLTFNIDFIKGLFGSGGSKGASQ